MDVSVSSLKKEGLESPITEEKSKFNTDEVVAIIKETVESVIQDTEYSHGKVAAWHSDIVDTCLKKVKEMSKNYKFVVTCAIMQKSGAGFYTGSSVYWDNQQDGK
ncbi:Dynein molecular motor protein light chain 1 [Apophysomyces sp. BC1015]|nr:Dynein molecular motor protein light chain 1 [Apophysomyces sp. BC1015]